MHAPMLGCRRNAVSCCHKGWMGHPCAECDPGADRRGWRRRERVLWMRDQGLLPSRPR